MSVAQEYRKIIITEYLAPMLKHHGYRKKNNLFFQQQPEVIKLISIQNSNLTIPETCEFTINLGVYFPAVAQILEQANDNKMPSRAELGQINIRIGNLIPSARRDRWWLILPDSNWKSVAEEVTNAVEAYGLSWVDSLASRNAAKSHVIVNKNYLLAAAFSLADGNNDEAKKYMEKRISEERPLHPIWFEWAKKNGLLS